MRKSLILITTVFAMFLLLPLASCQHSSDSNTSFNNTSNTSIVSVWISESGATFTFYDDGTYTYENGQTKSHGTYSGSLSSGSGSVTLTSDDGKSGFSFEMNGDSATVYETEDGKKKSGDNGTSFKKESSSGATGDSYIDTTEYDFIGTVSEVVGYLGTLENEETEKRTYYVKVVDSKTTDSSNLRTALRALEDFEGIYISLNLYESVVSISGNDAFSYCEILAAITLPSNAKTIGKYTFNRCYALSSVTIPSNITTIGNYAFELCNSLVSIEIPSSITSIGDYAFFNCYILEYVTIPLSVIHIGESAFKQCFHLASVIFEDTVSDWDVYENGVTYLKTITASELQDSSYAAKYLRDTTWSLEKVVK